MIVNIILFEGLTQLDLTGPYEVLSRAPNAQLELVGLSKGLVRSDRGLMLMPSVSIHEAQPCDLLVVPGGPGTDEAMLNPHWLDFIRAQANTAGVVMGVCTGSLLLGAAGLLVGKLATSHWQAREFLPQFGAEISVARTCFDGKFFTAGGVTSGIDMALTTVASIYGADVAKQIQLQIEYDPEPPFRGGTPLTSEPEIVSRCLAATASRRALRANAVLRAALKLPGNKP